MTWRRERDYHAYRSYPRDDAAGRASGGILAGLKRVLDFIARPTPPAVTLKISNRELSRLSGRDAFGRAADCPFPTNVSAMRPRHHDG